LKRAERVKLLYRPSTISSNIIAAEVARWHQILLKQDRRPRQRGRGEEASMAVGFEFATGWDIHKLHDGVNPAHGTAINDQWIAANTTNYPKGAVVRGGFGWSMTVDGTEIEWVVNEVEESAAGAIQLAQVMSDLTRFVGMLNLRNMQSFLTAADFPINTFHAPNDRFIIHIRRGLRMKPIESISQVTGGIRLARVRKLWRLLADPDSQAAKIFFGGEPGGAAGYSGLLKPVILDHTDMRDPNWADHVPSAKLRGLLTMIMTYLKRGYSPLQRPVGAVKYLFLLMSRTSFGGLFKNLPWEERNHYRTEQGKAEWVEYVCTHLMSEVPGMPGAGVDPDGMLIERKVNDRSDLSHAQSVTLPITRKAWLEGIVDGRDLLSAAEHPLGGDDNALWADSNAELGHRLRGLAGLGDKMDTVMYGGRTNKAAIIEFRARQAALEYTLWAGYAAAMHSFITEINESERHGVIDLAPLA
jgi:hypothetical protein